MTWGVAGVDEEDHHGNGRRQGVRETRGVGGGGVCVVVEAPSREVLAPRGHRSESFHGLVASQLTGVHAAPQGIRVCQTSVECDRTHTILCPHHLAFIDYTLHNLRVFG